jgi:putative oxidoreductase
MSTTSTTDPAGRSPVRQGVWGNRLVWALQALLALVFLAHGVMMLFPPAEVAKLMNAALPRWFQLFIGIAEVLASVGLIVPALTGIEPWLVAWAAGGLIVVMVSATIFHLMRGEYSSAATTIVLLGMATVVARARYRPRVR